ncbi:MAG: quinone-dependent dihydroorotate dehydrogenase [Gammaproteobacteria bacterium]
MPGAQYKLLRPLLFALPPEAAHQAALAALRLRAALRPLLPPPALPVAAMGLQFPNPLGLAAGFDKNADSVDALSALGFGFIETGAITPQPQAGNPQPRIFRLPQAGALINRMGFNNCGMAAAARHLANRRNRNIIVGVNLGKNAATPLSDAAGDYCQLLRALYSGGDFFTLNISSPNTAGLRELEKPDLLQNLLSAVVRERDSLARQHGRRAPLAVKLSPDMDAESLAAAAEIIAAENIDGVIACNTTQERPPEIAALPAASEKGGLSGAPLTARALAMLRDLRKILPAKTAIIGAGGIMSGEDARARLDAGADLIQIYTGLIYQGPGFPREILRKLQKSENN